MLFTLSLLIFSAPFEAPCKPTHQADAGELQYLACAGGLLFTYKKGDEGPVELRREQLDGEIIGFHNGKGRLWVEIAKSHAIPLGSLEMGKTSVLQLRAPAVLATAPQAAERPKTNPMTATPDPPATATTAVLEGRVIGRLPGRVVIDLGIKNGIKRGDSIEVFRRDQVTLAEDTGSMTQETTLVVA